MTNKTASLKKDSEYVVASLYSLINEKGHKALDAGAELAKKVLEEACPCDSKSSGIHLRDSFEIIGKHRGITARYIHNKKLTKEGIPLINLVEYSKNGHPFVRKTLKKNQSAINNEIQKYLK